MDEIRRLRMAAGLTQAELAARSGVAQPNIAAYESGQRRPSAAMLDRMRRAARPRPSAVIAEKRGQILAIAKEHKASNVRVFGSAARGDDTSGSDLDLLVTLAPDATVFDLAELTVELEEMTGLHVDVVSEGGLRPGVNRIRDEAVAL
ncbi:helix-turn-helix domain-containing protein [Sinomonas sp. RB5]